MEKEGKNQIQRAKETTDFVLQWGNRKRLRCCKLKKDTKILDESNNNNSGNNNKNKLTTDSLSKKKSASRIVSLEKGSPHRLSKNSDLPLNNRKPSVASPEKEDRYYTTRGSSGLDENGKVLMDHLKEDKKTFVWPKLFIALSNKEKEEDFMVMKGCKPSQRPKKRAKLIQRSILLVSPGAWLSDLCQERYEVREKKTSKKRPRGLKAMGSMESDSE